MEEDNKIPDFVIKYRQACINYKDELKAHAEAQMRYAKALQTYQSEFDEFIARRDLEITKNGRNAASIKS